MSRLALQALLQFANGSALDPFANCGAGEAGIEVLRGELDSPFGTTDWCCGNTTWSSFSWRAKATRNVDFAVTNPSAAVPGGQSNASECTAHAATAPDCFSFCFNSSRGGPCSPLKGPTGPTPPACQTALDAVCNAPANAHCINDTVKNFGQHALPLVGLYDAGLYNSSTGMHLSAPQWRCYAQNALDASHKHWDNQSAIPVTCWSNTALKNSLEAAFASTSACKAVTPSLPAYPADTWTDWYDFRPGDPTTSHLDKNLTTTVGAFHCTSYPNEYLDPIQHLVLPLSIHGVYPGNSSNITVEVRPVSPAGPTYQLTAMMAPVTGSIVAGISRPLALPFMLARENLTTAANHLGPMVAAATRPLVTEHEHNSAVFKALPQNKKTPKKIQVVQGCTC